MEVAVRQQSLCLLLEEGVSRKRGASDKLWNFKTQFGNFLKGGWISSKNVFIVPTRKGETLPKLADLLKTNFSLSSRKENISQLHKSLLSVGNEG